MRSAQSNCPSLQEIPLPKSSASPSSPGKTSVTEFSKVSLKVISENGSQDHKAKYVTQPPKKAQKEIKWRPLKLIFDHDIRLAQVLEIAWIIDLYKLDLVFKCSKFQRQWSCRNVPISLEWSIASTIYFFFHGLCF